MSPGAVASVETAMPAEPMIPAMESTEEIGTSDDEVGRIRGVPVCVRRVVSVVIAVAIAIVLVDRIRRVVLTVRIAA
jgi:hypothetical protein